METPTRLLWCLHTYIETLTYNTKIYIVTTLHYLTQTNTHIHRNTHKTLCTLYIFWFCRKRYKRLLQCVVVIQKNWRALFWRRRFLMLRWASITLQKRIRGQKARQLYIQLLQGKKRRLEEEQKQREEEETRERLYFIPKKKNKAFKCVKNLNLAKMLFW